MVVVGLVKRNAELSILMETTTTMMDRVHRIHYEHANLHQKRKSVRDVREGAGGCLPSFLGKIFDCSSDKLKWWRSCNNRLDIDESLLDELITAETMAGSSWIEACFASGAGGAGVGTEATGCFFAEPSADCSSSTIFRSSISLFANCMIGTLLVGTWPFERFPPRFSVPKHLTLPRIIDDASASMPGTKGDRISITDPGKTSYQ